MASLSYFFIPGIYSMGCEKKREESEHFGLSFPKHFNQQELFSKDHAELLG